MGYKSKFKGSTVDDRLRAVAKKQDTLVSGQNIKTIVGESVLGGGNLDILYKSITYQALLDLREESKLKPGQFYRITDYVTTTSQVNTKSAGNPFDVIVLALTNDTLAERAWACHRDGNTYFQNSHFEVWQIWYCLDNDADRFEWAVPISEGGRGVIYRMIDEFNNDCPYDFKNIQFYRKYDASKSLWSISSDNTGVPCYTFSSTGSSSTTSFIDMSLDSGGIYSNVIKAYIGSNKQSLNNNCFFADTCSSNILGDNCTGNTFGNNCSANIFGKNCINNSFGPNCSLNTFGNNCYSNFFRSNCQHNLFGDTCKSNIFGTYCQHNLFGNYCQNNIFGTYCQYNSFENYCLYIKFASSKDDSNSTIYNYYQYNHFGDGCSYILFKGAGSSFQYMQNYNFAQGLQGTSGEYLSIDGERNRAYETKVAKNSSGELKQYCEADMM